MPTPVSRTTSVAPPSSSRTATVTVPPAAVCRRAFVDEVDHHLGEAVGIAVDARGFDIDAQRDADLRRAWFERLCNVEATLERSTPRAAGASGPLRRA